VHWLSKVPCNIPDHVYAQRAGQSVRKAYAEQAREDWQRFLGHRARELRPDADVVDLGDVTLLPGLIDAHVHLVWNASAEPHELVARGARLDGVALCS
jgi:salicylate 1-O-methyltransferase